MPKGAKGQRLVPATLLTKVPEILRADKQYQKDFLSQRNQPSSDGHLAQLDFDSDVDEPAPAQQPAALPQQPAALPQQPATLPLHPAATAQQPAALLTQQLVALLPQQPAALPQQPLAVAPQPAALAQQPAAHGHEPRGHAVLHVNEDPVANVPPPAVALPLPTVPPPPLGAPAYGALSAALGDPSIQPGTTLPGPAMPPPLRCTAPTAPLSQCSMPPRAQQRPLAPASSSADAPPLQPAIVHHSSNSVPGRPADGTPLAGSDALLTMALNPLESLSFGIAPTLGGPIAAIDVPAGSSGLAYATSASVVCGAHEAVMQRSSDAPVRSQKRSQPDAHGAQLEVRRGSRPKVARKVHDA